MSETLTAGRDLDYRIHALLHGPPPQGMCWYDPVPEYSTKAAAALQALEALKSDGYSINLRIISDVPTPYQISTLGRERTARLVELEDASFCLAVCRLVVAVKGEK